MRTIFPAVALAVCLLCPQESQAMGEIYMRVAQDTNMAKCGTGKLVEYLHTGGNVHGFFSSYVLACLKTETTAEWVLISGTSCDDQSEKERHECNGKRAGLVPRFEKNGDFWQAKPVAGKIKLGYNLIKYGFGLDCHSVVQKYKSSLTGDSASEHTAWVCDTLDLNDGTYEDYTRIEDPRKFKLYHLTTTGKETLKTSYPVAPFPSKADDSYTPALNFVLPDTNYTYDVRGR